MAIIHRTVNSWSRVEQAMRNQDPRKEPRLNYHPQKSRDYRPPEQCKVEQFREQSKKSARDVVFSEIERLKKEITIRSNALKTNTLPEETIDEPSRKPILKSIPQMQQELNYLMNNTENAVEQIYKIWIKSTLVFLEDEDNRNDLKGAFGELRAERELRKLPDSYHVLNDFKFKFIKPIYKWDTEECIKGIQVDHTVIGPTGVFVIETKNWSKSSIDNPEHNSPIDQVNKYGLSLVKLLNNASSLSPAFKHHWGHQIKIKVHNIVYWPNDKPNVDFPLVKMCGKGELNPFIEGYRLEFDSKQIQELVVYLLSICKMD
jgi:hypothetical protein